MPTYRGTNQDDRADAVDGMLTGFTGGTVSQLQDNGGDLFFAGIGADFVRAGAGNDIISGEAGIDQLDGGAGDDRIIGGLGADVLTGGTGTDTADYSDDWGAVQVFLSTGTATGNAADGDTLTGFENVRGSLSFGDYLVGDGATNFLDGLGGDDVIEGGAGDDRLRGGLGADGLVGGDGIDTVDYLDNFGAVFVNLLARAGFGNAAQGDYYAQIENVTGSAYADTLIGDNGANRLDGSEGDDVLIGGLGADVLVGGTGNDTASYADNQGSVFVNFATGRGFNNAAEGDTYSGIENVVGTAFDDMLIGGGELSGTFDAGAGNDIVYLGFAQRGASGGAGLDAVSLEAGGSAQLNLLTGFTDNLTSLSGFENIIGNGLANVLTGDNGDNVINGKTGADNLTGNGGVDTFVFDNIGAVDRVRDFSSNDRIIFQGLAFDVARGPLAPDALAIGAGATLPEHRFVFNPANSTLFYDRDGAGGAAQVSIAILEGVTSLSVEAILVL